MEPGHLGFISRILKFRCPTCEEVQPYSDVLGTVRPRDASEAHQCAKCGDMLIGRLPFLVQLLAFLVFIGPVFMTSESIGFAVLSDVPLISHFHEGRGYLEVNFVGFLIVVSLFVFPASFVAQLISARVITKIEVDKGWRRT